jgi:hypothetical protein
MPASVDMLRCHFVKCLHGEWHNGECLLVTVVRLNGVKLMEMDESDIHTTLQHVVTK